MFIIYYILPYRLRNLVIDKELSRWCSYNYSVCEISLGFPRAEQRRQRTRGELGAEASPAHLCTFSFNHLTILQLITRYLYYRKNNYQSMLFYCGNRERCNQEVSKIEKFLKTMRYEI